MSSGSGTTRKLSHMPAAKQVAAHLAAATSLYGIKESKDEEMRDLRFQLVAEKEKKMVARAMVEQLQAALNSRDAQVRSLMAQLSSMETQVASATAAVAAAEAAAAEAKKQHAVEAGRAMEAGAAAAAAAATAAAAEAAAAAAAAAARAAPAPGDLSAFHGPHRSSPAGFHSLASSSSSPHREYDPNVSLTRLRGLEGENSQLRSVAVTLQSQRDAFESVARQLQDHSLSVEKAFEALQLESQAVWEYSQVQEENLRKAKKTQTGYENGLAQLLLLLGRQQEKVKRHIREADAVLNELTPAVRTLGEVASSSGEGGGDAPTSAPAPRIHYTYAPLPAIIDGQMGGGGGGGGGQGGSHPPPHHSHSHQQHQQHQQHQPSSSHHSQQHHLQRHPSIHTHSHQHESTPHSTRGGYEGVGGGEGGSGGSGSGGGGGGGGDSSHYQHQHPGGATLSPRSATIRLPPIVKPHTPAVAPPTLASVGGGGGGVNPPSPTSAANNFTTSGKPIVQRTLNKSSSVPHTLAPPTQAPSPTIPPLGMQSFGGEASSQQQQQPQQQQQQQGDGLTALVDSPTLPPQLPVEVHPFPVVDTSAPGNSGEIGDALLVAFPGSTPPASQTGEGGGLTNPSPAAPAPAADLDPQDNPPAPVAPASELVPAAPASVAAAAAQAPEVVEVAVGSADSAIPAAAPPPVAPTTSASVLPPPLLAEGVEEEPVGVVPFSPISKPIAARQPLELA